MSDLVVYTFSPAFGLPTSGPFPLKLLKWLELAGMPYRQVFEDDPGKGPNKKSPWIEIAGQRIADSELIIDFLAPRTGFDIDAGLTAEQRATTHALRRMLEEHFHMVFEWEMFAHPAGIPFVQEVAGGLVPKPMIGPVASIFRRKMKKQLYARGIARHDDQTIARKGRADVDAVEALLGNKPFLAGERISMADLSAYGLLMPMLRWPMQTPVADYIKSRPVLGAYLERIHKLRVEQRLAA